MLLCNKYKKIIIGVMLTLFLYNSFGYLLVYFPSSLLIKYIVHKSIKEKKINPEELSILSFSISDLKNNKYDFVWKKPGKEFQFNGKLYDIENQKAIDDSIHYTVYYDHKENILEELLSFQQKDNKKEKASNTMQRIVFTGLYFEKINKQFFEIYKSRSTFIPIKKNELDFVKIISDIPTPPPRTLS